MEFLELEETYYAVETEMYDIPYDIYPVIGLVIRNDGFHYLYRYAGRVRPVEKYDASFVFEADDTGCADIKEGLASGRYFFKNEELYEYSWFERLLGMHRR